ncbi:MAG: hypothetical protein ACPG4K_14865, partial [Haloferula sp.]
FATQLEPLADAFHQTCRFPENHRQIVAAFDGTHDQEDLREIARDLAPDLDFDPWLAHLASRGLLPEVSG